MKTEFILGIAGYNKNQRGIVNIIGQRPDNHPYVSIDFQEHGSQIASGWIEDKDLERFAVNILKALKSKHLRQQ